MAERTTKAVSINLALAKTVIDWSLKLIPIFAFLVQFYLNQDRTVDRSKRGEDSIRDLQTKVNELERRIVQNHEAWLVTNQKLEDRDKYAVLTGKK